MSAKSVDHQAELFVAVQSQNAEAARTLLTVEALRKQLTASTSSSASDSPPVIDVNKADANGDTALHLARNYDIVELLLARNTNVNARNHHHETPLIHSIWLDNDVELSRL